MLQDIKAIYRNPTYQRYALLALVFVISVVQVAAQTATPTTPSITIPTDSMLSYLNTWVAAFAPIILFIGMIPVAIGLLRYIINMFRGAFGG